MGALILTIIPSHRASHSEDLAAIWAFASDDEFRSSIRAISQKTAVTVGRAA